MMFAAVVLPALSCASKALLALATTTPRMSAVMVDTSVIARRTESSVSLVASDAGKAVRRLLASSAPPNVQVSVMSVIVMGFNRIPFAAQSADEGLVTTDGACRSSRRRRRGPDEEKAAMTMRVQSGRAWLRSVLVVAGIAGAATAWSATPPTSHAASAPAPPTPSAVLSELKAGNQRHVSHQYQHPHQSAARQKELVKGQSPHAVILACADSRVAPEIVFDRGLGDLFTVRVAGNIATDAEVASIEYAAEHLHTPLVVVMGHQSCGAVGAAIQGGEAAGHLSTLVHAIQPSVDAARKLPGDLTANAVRLNVENVVQQLRTSKPVLAPLVSEGKLKIVGAVYSLDTGRVEWLPEK
jgi:carbonic anhydrase